MCASCLGKGLGEQLVPPASATRRSSRGAWLTHSPALTTAHDVWKVGIVPIIRYSRLMPPKILGDDVLLARLLDVFRTFGYEGASLARIARASGLQRSSLYHRFPGGKQQMAEAVARQVGADFAQRVLAGAGADVPLADRIALIAAELDRFYAGGTKACVLDALSVGDAGAATSECLAGAARAWFDVFASLAREAGVEPKAARHRAEDAVARIEGALVLARATGNTRPFTRALAELGTSLTASP